MAHSRPSEQRLDLFPEDCVEGMRNRLEAESVDLVVTSPPYNLGIDYGTYADNRAREEYLTWCDSWADQIARVLKPEGSFFLNIGGSPSNPYLPHELVLRLRDRFALQNTFHWIKSISIETPEGVFSKGHFKPISSNRFVNDCHEYLFHLTRTGQVPVNRKAVGVPYADKSNIARWGHTVGKDRRCRGNTWFIPYRTIQSRAGQRPHPATFPVELAEKCILLHGANEHSCMLDPFLGIGTSALAARNQGVGRFIGFEIDPEYLKVAEIRAETTARSRAGALSRGAAQRDQKNSLVREFHRIGREMK